MLVKSVLRLSAGQTCITAEGSSPVIMSVSPERLVEVAFRNGRPQAAHLESAINLVEDAISATGLRTKPRGALVVDAQDLRQAFRAIDIPAYLSVAQVEQRYQDIALSAQRLANVPVSEIDPLPLATLILVRECMHHLGYAELILV